MLTRNAGTYLQVHNALLPRQPTMVQSVLPHSYTFFSPRNTFAEMMALSRDALQYTINISLVSGYVPSESVYFATGRSSLPQATRTIGAWHKYKLVTAGPFAPQSRTPYRCKSTKTSHQFEPHIVIQQPMPCPLGLSSSVHNTRT